MRITPLFVAAALVLGVSLSAQPTASFAVFGTACSSPNGRTCNMGNRGVPVVGQSFDILYSGPNFTFNSSQQSAAPSLMLGLSNAATPIPQIFPAQPTGCFLWQSANIIIPMPADPNKPVYLSSFTVNVPNDPSALGQVFFAQWFTVFTQCGIVSCDPMWLITSEGATATIGL